MSARRVIVDCPSHPRSAEVCPHCGASLPSAPVDDLRFTRHNLFRCASGRHPRVGLLRCRGCDRLLAVHEAGGSLGSGGRLVLVANQARTLEIIRERDREDQADDVHDSLKRRD